MNRKYCLIRRLLKQRPFLIGLCILIFLFLFSVMTPLVIKWNPLEMSTDFFRPPSFGHLFGTDSFGRDVAARICFGARTSILLGFSVMLTSTFGGLVVGLLSGVSKRLDFFSVQTIDILMAFPELILALGIMAILGQTTANIVIALTAVYTAKMARVARSSVLSIGEQTYIEAARGIGSSRLRIFLLDVLRHPVAPIIVQGSFVFGWIIILEAGLSFAGEGIQLPTASLGNILMVFQ